MNILNPDGAQMFAGVLIGIAVTVIMTGITTRVEATHQKKNVCVTVDLPHRGEKVTQWIHGFKVEISKP